jgi:formamidopyrimidine-DNA glycosylase
MPELPEAETIVRGLRRTVSGRLVESVQVLHDDVLRVPPARFRRCVSGRTIHEVRRRGKNVVFRLSGDHVLLVNLGMTGRLLTLAPTGVGAAFPPTHPALRFKLGGGSTLVFDDVRRFGTVECLSDAEWSARDETLGPEPLADAFTPAGLARQLARSRSPIRSWLLDQRNVAGVGNIYANEALWRARIHPRRPANQLGRADAKRLHAALRDVLTMAIEAQGTTLRDYRTSDGESGGFGISLSVYGRQGSPCPRCGSSVERLVFGNRSAFLCPRCQPAAGRPARGARS